LIFRIPWMTSSAWKRGGWLEAGADWGMMRHLGVAGDYASKNSI
jgi:hypothetical protein